ncbi:hypothetical protein K1719_017919 [Acacia pycnantha]|nr:hypothetical protein K1719_017919 [Acacia pycnantha]
MMPLSGEIGGSYEETGERRRRYRGVRVYDEVALRLRGSRAKLNFPENVRAVPVLVQNFPASSHVFQSSSTAAFPFLQASSFQGPPDLVRDYWNYTQLSDDFHGQ